MYQLISSLFINIVLLCLAKSLFADSVCGDWQTYYDEKCFKIFDALQSYDEAINTCSQYSGTLVTIQSLEEQQFIETYLFTTQKIVENVWIGLKYTNSRYKWVNDFYANYTHWSDGSPKNRSDYCVQIDSDDGLIGKWSDVSCTKRNLVMCQKLPTLTIQSLQSMLIATRKQTDNIIQQLTNKLENSIIQQNITIHTLNTTVNAMTSINQELSNKLENSLIKQNVTNLVLEITMNTLNTTVNAMTSMNQQLSNKLENSLIQQNATNHMLEDTSRRLNTTVNELSVSKKQFDYFFTDKWIEFQTFVENNTRKAFFYPYKTQSTFIRSDALQICRQYNASLVDIESIEKQKHVESFLNKINPKTDYYYYWLGGYIDSTNNYKYKGLNSGNVLTYTNWASGHPMSNIPYILINFNTADSHYSQWYSVLSTNTANVFCEITFH